MAVAVGAPDHLGLTRRGSRLTQLARRSLRPDALPFNRTATAAPALPARPLPDSAGERVRRLQALSFHRTAIPALRHLRNVSPRGIGSRFPPGGSCPAVGSACRGSRRVADVLAEWAGIALSLDVGDHTLRSDTPAAEVTAGLGEVGADLPVRLVAGRGAEPAVQAEGGESRGCGSRRVLWLRLGRGRVLWRGRVRGVWRGRGRAVWRV